MFLNNGVYKDKQILGKKTVELVYINQNKHIKNSQVSLVFGLIGKDDQYIGGQGSKVPNMGWIFVHITLPILLKT